MVQLENRIAALLPPQTSTGPAPRSEAQRAASRANGRTSSGPRTEAGKSRSAANALKHGLLARRFVPQADTRDDDKLYRRTLRELTVEYSPTSFAHRLTLESVAHDLVQFARARQMVETLQKPAAMTAEQEADFQLHRKLHSDTRVVKEVLAAIEAGTFNCKPRQASQAADMIAAKVQALEEWFNDPDAIPYPKMDAEEKQEYDQYAGEYAPLKQYRLSLLNQVFMQSVLTGDKTVPAHNLKRLRHALELLLRDTESRFASGKVAMNRLRQRQAATSQTIAYAPEKLMLVSSYVAKIERAVNRKLRSLSRR